MPCGICCSVDSDGITLLMAWACEMAFTGVAVSWFFGIMVYVCEYER
jgi:hypothetical protein